MISFLDRIIQFELMILYIHQNVKKSLLWPRKAKKALHFVPKTYHLRTLLRPTTLWFRKKVVFSSKHCLFLRKLFWPFTHCFRKKVVLLLLCNMSSQKFVTPTEEIRVLKKGHKKTKLFDILFSPKNSFLLLILDQKCRISSRITRSKKVHMSKIPETTWL